MSDELIREVEGDMQRERMAALWKRFGNNILTISALVIAFTAGYTLWQNHENSKQADATSHLLAGQDAYATGQFDQAVVEFGRVREQGTPLLRDVGALWLGHSFFAKEDRANAITQWQDAAKSQDAAIANAATLYLAVYGNKSIESIPSSTAPFAQSLTEQYALQLAGAKDYAGMDTALTTLEQNSADMPSMQQRVQLLQLLSQETIAKAFGADKQAAPQEGSDE